MRWHRVAFFVCGILAPIAACGTSAMNTDACTKIESARCNKATEFAASSGCYFPDSSVAVDFMAPYGSNATGPSGQAQNYAACVQFYSVACLHGTVTNVAPPASYSVMNCIDSLNDATSCAQLFDLDANPACSWLGNVVDSGSDAPPVIDSGPCVPTPFDVCLPVDSGNPVDTGTDVFDAAFLDVDADGQMGIMLERNR